MIKIEWVEEATTKTGKSYKKVSTDGKNSIPCWPWKVTPEFYASILPGAEVDGKIVVDGKFSSLESVIAKNANGTERPSGNWKEKSVEKAMDRKETGIKTFQESKEGGIMISSTFRDATLLTQAEMTGASVEDLKSRWLAWREWLLQNFDKDIKDYKKPF